MRETRPPLVVGARSAFSCGDFLQYFDIEVPLGQELLEAMVLVLKGLQSLGFGYVRVPKRRSQANSVCSLTPCLLATSATEDFVGYTGRPAGGPPDSITIRRRLDFIAPVALTLQQLEHDGKV